MTRPSLPQHPHRVRLASIQKAWLVAQWQQLVARRTRLQQLALAVIVLGTISLVVESVTIGGCRIVRHSVELAQFAWKQSVGAWDADSIDTRTPMPPPPPPPSVFATTTERMCFYQRDVGLETEIRAAQQVFCDRDDHGDDEAKRTRVTLVDLGDRGLHLRTMRFERGLALDLTRATIHAPIASLADDGGAHDPRFNWDASMLTCRCSELQQYAAERFTASGNTTTLRLWDPQLANTPAAVDEASTVCASSTTEPASTSDTSHVLAIHEKTIVIARRDDHNPFFQISNALNAWLLMRAFGWSRDETRVVHLDGGYASPIDALHHRLLSSPAKWPLLRGRDDLVGRTIRFTNDVVVAPYEVSGPMMQHLNTKEPCYDSYLFHAFRDESLEAMGVRETVVDTRRPLTVTIITRRDYGGRVVQRRWLNEDDVLAAMRQRYADSSVPLVIQSVDFVDLPLADQMRVALESDVVIGMHGAGMVNVLWTKPETLVVEIFPKKRWRWGYRNLCQFVGCDWHQFRGGVDTGSGDNKSDKTIPVDEWLAFFDPLVRTYRDKIATKTSAPRLRR